ncbi:hypothetical protein PLICRDRAFT_583541 [Plicaturopsis crispa FD-325 SS-3]|nr:hypothetical protein PLICRDRAFT_583541 [Plicaturopsis crispa FD-325 SS-3]
MPPGPTYNFLCALCSAADILSHAVQIRAAQATRTTSAASALSRKRKQRDTGLNAGTRAATSEAARLEGHGEGSALSMRPGLESRPVAPPDDDVFARTPPVANNASSSGLEKRGVSKETYATLPSQAPPRVEKNVSNHPYPYYPASETGTKVQEPKSQEESPKPIPCGNTSRLGPDTESPILQGSVFSYWPSIPLRRTGGLIGIWCSIRSAPPVHRLV